MHLVDLVKEDFVHKKMNTNSIDITGKTFNHLFVIEPTNKRTRHSIVWKCKCDCGNICYANSSDIRTGETKSCGCIKNIAISKARTLKSGNSMLNRLYSNYKNRARVDNLTFSLDKEQFKYLTSSACYYCNEPPSNMYGRRDSSSTYIYNGIDRSDNNIGYEIDNCVSCCWKCNQAKRNYSKDEFLSWIRRIYDNRLSK